MRRIARAATALAFIGAAALLLGACVEVEIVRIPARENGVEAAKDCQEKAKKSGQDSFELEGSCLMLIPDTRVETVTFQPGSPPARPAGCALLSISKGRNSERWVYACGR